MCRFPVNHTCGYLYNHTTAVYRTADLSSGSFERLTLDALPGSEASLPGVKFRVKVIFNPLTSLYVMWVRVVPLVGGAGGAEPNWLGEAYATATSSHPEGPFSVVSPRVPVRYAPGGDNSVFVDAADGRAYLIYTSHATGVRMSVERLSKDFTSTTNESSGPFGPKGVEAPAMFKRGIYYYVSFGPICCYCVQGSDTSLYASKAPLGPYTLVLDHFAPRLATHAQQSFIFETAGRETGGDGKGGSSGDSSGGSSGGGRWIWTGTRWGSATTRPGGDGVMNHDLQTWLPLPPWTNGTSATGGVPVPSGPVKWVDSFELK
eukprot:g4646.t1